ncbi:MAG: ECF transporter S component [Eubacteriales bacterium]
MEENRKALKQIVLAGIFAALVFVVTYFVKIPVPQISRGAYINLGDTAIYIIASLINPLYAMFAAGFGSMLADIAYGGGIYIPATLVIKGLMGLVAAKIAKRGQFGAYVVACLVAGAIMVVGYGAFETFLLGGIKPALASSVFNLIQFAGGVILALPFYAVLPRIKKAGNL